MSGPSGRDIATEATEGLQPARATARLITHHMVGSN
jgi:hypothetical protein